MFDETFTFDTLRSPSWDSLATAPSRHSSRPVSPCTASGTFPSPQLSIADLATQFAAQRLERGEAQICYDPCETYANTDDDDAEWLIPGLDEAIDSNPLLPRRAGTFPAAARQHSPSRRDQRQVNTRLLCSASHRQAIATLVARMVDDEEQCCVTPLESDTPLPEEDEGYNSGEEPVLDGSRRSSIVVQARSERRRASDLVAGGACVNKRVRLRREKRHGRVRSSETMP